MSTRGAATGQLQREIRGHSDFVWSVAFSPSGERVASGSAENTVRFWVAATVQLQRELKGHGGAVTSVSFSPSGARVASGSMDIGRSHVKTPHTNIQK